MVFSALPACVSSALVNAATRYPANGDLPSASAVASSAAGAWHTTPSGLPEASAAVSRRPESAFTARSSIGPWPPG
ncbi:hypothetical protein ACFXPS_22805 [Nocardia sp. NPDC059091]|uniref:hypothetical protein n=1 Tax=Nocardia sp. NPDC059091 TaxID=3346724 RepID=UPI0036B0AA72